MNTFGKLFCLTTAGESHGPAMVGIVDGMPAGFKLDFEKIKTELNRRRPGGRYMSARNEEDEPEFLSGLLDGVTLGTPIAFIVRNRDAREEDYEHLKHTFRPNHADFTYQAKYGIRDVKGGGRASARETLLRVVAGSMAVQVLESRGISVDAYTVRIGNVECGAEEPDLRKIYSSPVFCPFPETSKAMEAELESVRRDGDTVGCQIRCVINGLPPGVGEPVYDKLSARLGYAMMSINAAHGFTYGGGVNLSTARGTEVMDNFEILADGDIGTSTNHSGGIQGGISNGMPVVADVYFKPLPTVMHATESVDHKGRRHVIEPRGRHDVCAAPRAVAVVRAMGAITVLDELMQYESRRRLP